MLKTWRIHLRRHSTNACRTLLQHQTLRTFVEYLLMKKWVSEVAKVYTSTWMSPPTTWSLPKCWLTETSSDKLNYTSNFEPSPKISALRPLMDRWKLMENGLISYFIKPREERLNSHGVNFNPSAKYAILTSWCYCHSCRWEAGKSTLSQTENWWNSN